MGYRHTASHARRENGMCEGREVGGSSVWLGDYDTLWAAGRRARVQAKVGRKCRLYFLILDL